MVPVYDAPIVLLPPTFYLFPHADRSLMPKVGLFFVGLGEPPYYKTLMAGVRLHLNVSCRLPRPSCTRKTADLALPPSPQKPSRSNLGGSTPPPPCPPMQLAVFFFGNCIPLDGLCCPPVLYDWLWPSPLCPGALWPFPALPPQTASRSIAFPGPYGVL